MGIRESGKRIKAALNRNHSTSPHEDQGYDTTIPSSHSQQQKLSGHQSRQEYQQPSQAEPKHVAQQSRPETNSHSAPDQNRLSTSHAFGAHTSNPQDGHNLDPYGAQRPVTRSEPVSNADGAYYTSSSHRVSMQSRNPNVKYACGPSFVSDVHPNEVSPNGHYETQPSSGNNSHTGQLHQVHRGDAHFSKASDPQNMQSTNSSEKSKPYHTQSSQAHRFSSSGASQVTRSQPEPGPATSSQTEIPALALVGNPGSGKSTILNGFADKIVFESGISLGSGLTTTLNEYHHKGITLYDTPGLADVDRKKKAGQELDTLLSKHIPIKLVFVVTLERGRVRPEDALTIDLVLDAIKYSTRDRFGVIINQVTQRVREEIETSPEKEAKMRCSLTGKHSTSHWCYMNERSDLVDEKNGKLMSPDLMHFFWGLPETKPKEARTVPIDTDSMEEKLTQHKQIIEDIKTANAEQLRSMTEELRSQKEKYATQELQLRNVEQEINRLQAEAAATRAAVEAAVSSAKPGALQHELAHGLRNESQKKGVSGKLGTGLGPAFALSLIPAVVGPTVVEGYKAMHKHQDGQTEPTEGQSEQSSEANLQTYVNEGLTYDMETGAPQTDIQLPIFPDINAEKETSAPYDLNDNAIDQYGNLLGEDQEVTNVEGTDLWEL